MAILYTTCIIKNNTILLYSNIDLLIIGSGYVKNMHIRSICLESVEVIK